MKNLREHLTFDQANVVLENANEGKDLYMKGIMIQGGVRNANQRVYPVNEIGRAVKTLNDQITNGFSVLGEVDHPEGLNINDYLDCPRTTNVQYQKFSQHVKSEYYHRQIMYVADQMEHLAVRLAIVVAIL